jgi:CRP-like cAMP-binding protein
MSLDPTTPDVRRLLTRVPQLAQASFEARDAVAACLRARRTAPGEMVISIGAPGDSLYFVVEGEFEVTLSDHSLNLGPGDFFGEIGLLYGERTATVTSLSQGLLLTLPGEYLPRLRGVFPGIQAILEKAASERIQHR